jgi:hypothetical protein
MQLKAEVHKSNATDVYTDWSTKLASLHTVMEFCKGACSEPDRVLVIAVVRTLLLVQGSILQVVDSIDFCPLPAYIVYM